MWRLQSLLCLSRQRLNLIPCVYQRQLSVSMSYQVPVNASSTSNVVTASQPKPAIQNKQKPELARFQTSGLEGIREGQEVEGFVVQQISEVPDFHLTAVRLQHSKTGAQYLHIDRSDSNNAFSIGFRTTPTDSTGLPHILEHTTLCGSEKYPIRDPFFKMLNRSMATFMNAMTGPDYTMYPFSTQNPRDYMNLMSVYLDAVFKPKLRETDFKQEGWRLEHMDVSNRESPIIFKGVVFNEMKGVFSENQSLFGQELLNSILPSHTYRYVSGGDPLCIPSLTYEDLKAFHKKYYCPANSRFYSYGNFPLVQHLTFINQKYLVDSASVPNDGRKSAVPSEKRWAKERQKHIACRVDPMAADSQKQSSLAISYLCSDIQDVQETFILQVLSELLVKGPNSAFYKSLVEPNIGAGFSPVTGFDAQTRDSIFTVGLQGLNKSDFDKVVDIIHKTVDNVIEKGFEDKHIEGVIHGIELNVKHQSSDFGLGLLFGLTPLWNHDGDLIRALGVSNQVTFLMKCLKDNPRYLQDKVAQYFKNNPHRLILTMSPESDYEEKQAKAESSLLVKKISSLTKADKEVIFKDAIELLQLQQENEDLSALPTLRVADLKKDLERTITTDTIFSSIPVQVCPQPTNGITYLRGILNTSNVSEDLKMILPLFCHVASKMGTKGHDYRAFDKLVQLKTGGLGIGTHVAEDLNITTKYEEGIIFSTYCLDRNVKDMFSIWSELFNRVTLDDVKRFGTLSRVLAADLINGIVDMGHHYAMSSAAALVNPSARHKEIVGGLTHIRKMQEIAQMTDLEPVLMDMKKIATELFNKNHLRCSMNLCPTSLMDGLKEANTFIDTLQGSPDQNYILTNGTEMAGNTCVHHIHSIPVNFTAKAIATVPYCHPHFAPLRILSRLLSSKYLHPNVREKGGAYGSGATLSSNGVFTFYSYRDPNSTATLDIFDNSIKWVEENSFTEQDIEEAKIGVFQKVDSPVPPGSRGLGKFLYGMDDDLRQRHRVALMKVMREHIQEVASEYLSIRKRPYAKALIGPENPVLKNVHETWNFVR